MYIIMKSVYRALHFCCTKIHEEMEEESKFKIEGFFSEFIPGQELRRPPSCTHSLMLRVPLDFLNI